MYIALFDFLPSWHGAVAVNTILLDEETCMNFKVVVRECNPVPPDLSVDRFDEIEHRRLLLLKSANLRHRLITSTSVIVRHLSNLFRIHSNLVAVEPC